MNDTSSFFIQDKALFGSYPSQEIVDDFEEKGVVCFVDLTTDHEKHKLVRYTVNKGNYINFPIRDNYIPIDLFGFSKFICKITNIIQNLNDNQSIYVHCKGGHGRAGIVVSCLLCFINKITSYEALSLTNKCHSKRPVMKDKWRNIGSPQTDKQKEFVIRLFKPIYLNNVCNKNTYFPLNNNSKHTIIYNNTTYKNLNECLYSILYPEDRGEIEKCKNFHELRKIIQDKDGVLLDDDMITNLFKFKLTHYDDVRIILKKTLIRPILYKENNFDLGYYLNKIRFRLFMSDNFIL
jgi:hypothetical protein